MTDRFQMDLADARLIEMLRSRERDTASQIAVLQMHTQKLQGELQGARSDFVNAVVELSKKYGAPLQNYNIDPFTGETVINPQVAAMQHRAQSAVAQQADSEARNGTNTETKADPSPGVQAEVETTPGGEAADG